ncbi:8-amino-7-oxononanoate synthase [Chryseobacterium piperi]|uniref:8-amino-7-oxononanoate synthase n=1 Tax=Chryseobacterium piperi TaxID=558152 RepID=A0A086ALE6_9FLAO|nr:aminotransferase class I/II-fold pyridoxal phosphate-dependent enzyme [Chryseobacterium piperi]ASW73572.1 8-amino-7-oxononanoate synthase [Chryseobacterium piperi]KFF17510.1 8-amino-7-oxononanoate synthase [Chryseobacterium piperi]
MPAQFHHLRQALNQRKENGTFRCLRSGSKGIDFYSNDYLGLSRNKELQQWILQEVTANPGLLSGSTGSRLISGNSATVTETEQYIAREHHVPSALLFPSGYNANLALLSTLPGRQDTIIADEQIHRSIHDACMMSHAKKIKFKHNDLKSLENKLQRIEGNCYIAVESLYSMEGDFAPIQEMAELAQKYSAGLLVDEAHAFGVLGYGLIAKYQLQSQVLATVVTYGKALGAHGAAILTNELIRDYLINFASPFIYTTSAQDIQWMSIRTGYEFLKEHEKLSLDLRKNIKLFRKQRLKSPSSENSPIQAIIIPDNQRLKALQNALSEKGMLTYPIYSPTVKEGTERIRICLHSFNTEEEIIELARTIVKFI